MIGVIDSGLGGITTLSVLRSILPNEDYIYLADCSSAPYGNKSDDFILQRILDLTDYLKKRNVKAIVLACNTATNVAIDFIREREREIICVGVEPSIKPAFNELRWGKALVLLTPVTAKCQKFNSLISSFDLKKLIVCPLKDLAFDIEQNINDLSKLKSKIENLYNIYRDEYVESVVLGCTHYCLIKNYFTDIFKAKIYDSNTGTALRLYNLLHQSGKISRKGGSLELIKF